MSLHDYGLGLTTIAETNLLKLDRVQNEAMRVILGTTNDSPTETLIDLPPMQTRQKVERVKAYFSAVENAHTQKKNKSIFSLHKAVKDTAGYRLRRGKSWWVSQRTQYCRYAL